MNGDRVEAEQGAFTQAMAKLQHHRAEHEAMALAALVADGCGAFFRDQGMQYSARDVVGLTAAVLAYARRGGR